MTVYSLLHFAEALLWLTTVLGALAGFGDALLWLCGVRKSGLGSSVSAGVVILVLLGGILNLLHWIAPVAMIVIVIIGVGLASFLRLPLLMRYFNRKRNPLALIGWRSRVLLLIVFAVLALRVSASVHTSVYQTWDDKHFYLVEPLKTIELHYLAPDPFSERRVTSSLGGCYFLQDLMLAALPVQDVQLADRGLGLLLLTAIAFDLGLLFALKRGQSALLALFALIVPQIMFNQTFVVLPSALFLAMVAFAANERLTRDRPFLQAALIGGIAASISSFKSTYLPHAVLFFCFLYLLRLLDIPASRALRALVTAALGCLVVLLPWMIADHSASGTFFYPVLGKGFHYSAYGLFPQPANFSASVLLHKVVPFTIPIAAVVIAEAWIAWRDKLTLNILALSFACITAMLALGVSTGGDSVRRYNYPCMIPVLLLLYVVFARAATASPAPGSARKWMRVFEIGSAVLLVLTAFYIGFNSWTHEYPTMLQSLKIAAVDRPIEPPEVVREYATMENAIPAGGAILETLEFPFLLDFRARDFLIADFPGAASPPPGWPAKQSGDALASYLLAHSVRYLAYTYHSYADPEGSDTFLRGKLVTPGVSQWQRSQTLITLDAHRQYRELAATRHKVYEDRYIYVLDLASK